MVERERLAVLVSDDRRVMGGDRGVSDQAGALVDTSRGVSWFGLVPVYGALAAYFVAEREHVGTAVAFGVAMAAVVLIVLVMQVARCVVRLARRRGFRALSGRPLGGRWRG